MAEKFHSHKIDAIPTPDLKDAFRIAKIRFARRIDKPQVNNTDVAEHINAGVHRSMISLVVTGNATSAAIYNKIIKFIAEEAPEELPETIIKEVEEKYGR